MWRVFNGILTSSGTDRNVLILDSLTDEPFVYKEIPRSCFPTEQMDMEKAAMFEKLEKEALENFRRLERGRLVGC
jgi:hypothetical protein